MDTVVTHGKKETKAHSQKNSIHHAIHSGLGEHDPTIQVLNIPANQHNPEPPHTNIKPDVEAAFGFAYCCQCIRKYILKPQLLKVTHKSHHSTQSTHLPLITSSTCSTLTLALTYLLSVPRSPPSARPSTRHPFPACHAPSFHCSCQPHSTIQVSHSLDISLHWNAFSFNTSPSSAQSCSVLGCELLFVAYSWPTHVNTVLGEI